MCKVKKFHCLPRSPCQLSIPANYPSSNVKCNENFFFYAAFIYWMKSDALQKENARAQHPREAQKLLHYWHGILSSKSWNINLA